MAARGDPNSNRIRQLPRVATYLEEYVKTVNRIEGTVHGATVAHAPLLLLNGSNNPALICKMFELSQWLLTVEGKNGDASYDFSAITNIWIDLVHSCAKGLTQAQYSIRLALPMTRELPLAKKI